MILLGLCYERAGMMLRMTIVAGALALGLAVAGGQETQVQYLSGQGRDDMVTWDFYCTGGRNSGPWTKIGVPSNWELQGFGEYNYGNDRRKSSEQGKYRRTFSVPKSWGDKRVFIVFEGVMTDTEVWINGESAGPKHQGGFYRFKYDITDLLKPRDNLLEVTVSKVSSDPTVEAAERQADYWVFGGIYRPVYLEAVPKQSIAWLAIDARADGDFRMDVHLFGNGTADTVAAEIIGPDNTLLGKAFETPVSNGQDVVTLRTKVAGHKTWTAETPNLYRVKVNLRQGGSVVHTVTQRFGFRTFEVRPGDGLYLNGQKIVLRGICRHSFRPESGRSLSRQDNYDDVRLIREMNMDAVRMSHYPPDASFLDACDELGLYVLDELAGWHKPYYDTEVGKKLVKEMVTRDVCHPCILFWDNGNEGGFNLELDGQFALYDPQNRTVLHPWENFNGVDTHHYEGYESVQKRLSGPTLVMPTEFLHGLYDGGLGAGLDDYWNAMLASPMGAGGFLWVFADEGVVRTDRNGAIDVVGNAAPDGIVGPHHEKEGSFYAVREIWSPIHIGLDKLPADFDGTLKVDNRYDFTNLRDCTFEAVLADFPAPNEQATGHKLSSKHALSSPDVKPHEQGTLNLALPVNWRDADVLYLTAFDPQRRQVWTWSWDLRGTSYYADKYARSAPAQAGQIKVSEANGETRIEASGLAMLFSVQAGGLAKISRAGKEIAFSGPNLISGEAQPSSITTTRNEQDHSTQVLVNYEGNMHHTTWTVYPTGWVSLDCEYELNGQFDLFGIDFGFPEEQMRSMRCLGDGPYRVWKDRLKGGVLDVWANPYKNDIPGVTWDYPEFKGYYEDWRWVVFSTEQGDITIVNGTDDLFLGVYRPNDGPAPVRTKLDVPKTGITLLHGIPPIGTKSQPPNTLGPQGQKNQATGTYRATAWFHFGK
jgi:hypothetical protein